jgi:hypothetical protein
MSDLEILEMNYACSPGGVDTFEVYDGNDLIFDSTYLEEAVRFCYNFGRNFKVYTLTAYFKEYGLVDSN